MTGSFGLGKAGEGSVRHFCYRNENGAISARCGATDTTRYTARNNRSRSFTFNPATREEAIEMTTCKSCLKAVK